MTFVGAFGLGFVILFPTLNTFQASECLSNVLWVRYAALKMLLDFILIGFITLTFYLATNDMLTVSFWTVLNSFKLFDFVLSFLLTIHELKTK